MSWILMRFAVQEFYIIKSFGKFHLKNWILMVEKKGAQIVERKVSWTKRRADLGTRGFN